MKRKAAAFMVVCAMAAVTVLGGCGTEEAAAKAEEEAAEEAAEEDIAEEEEIEAEDADTDADEEIITAQEMLASTDYDVTEYVTLPDDYMDMTIELSYAYEVTDEQTQMYIEEYILAYYPDYVLTDKDTVEDGDIVDIDYVGTLDGEEFDGGSAEGYELTIGSGIFIDGFEDGLIDQKVGDTVDLDLTFPEDYSSEDLAGQDVVFTVTINGIMEETYLGYDEITDDYVEANFGIYGMTTVDDLIEDVEETLVSANESYEQSEIQNDVLIRLMDESVVDIPDGMLDERYDSYIEQIEEGAEMYGMEYEDYVISYSEYDDVESFEEDARSALESYLIEELILEAIVADQDISITRSEFDAFVDTYVAYYGFEDADAFYEYYGGETYVMLSYAENRALNDVIDAATVIKPEGESETGQEQAEEAEEAEEALEETETEEIGEAEEALEEEPLAEEVAEEDETEEDLEAETVAEEESVTGEEQEETDDGENE